MSDSPGVEYLYTKVAREETRNPSLRKKPIVVLMFDEEFDEEFDKEFDEFDEDFDEIYELLTGEDMETVEEL